MIFMLLLSSVAFAQTRQLTGTIKDAKSGAPLPAVTVQVKGKNIATVSGADGSYLLKAPAGAFTLQVSLVGYGTKTMEVTPDQTTLDLVLSESSTQLGELVVTALGISKESKKVGYSVTKVDGSLMTQARETNVGLSLAGRVAGVNVHGSSGGPGSSARILLRGLPSMNTTTGSPLFVINGVPIDNTQRGAANQWGGADNGDGLSNINPDDIESMTVLKGQSASALYGARAANGVIIITTKSGKKGAMNVEYNMNYSMDKAIDFTDWQYEFGQGTLGAKPRDAAGAQNSARLSWGSRLDGSMITQFDGKQYPYSPFRDNISNFYRTGSSFTNTVSVSGGGDRGVFRLSMSSLDNKSIVRNSGLDRKTVNLTLDQKVNDRLTIKVLANYIDEQQKNKPQLSDGPMNANNGIFLANNINEDILKPGFDPNAKGREVVFSDDIFVSNPWFVVNQYVNNVNRKRLISAVTARYELTSWLYAQGRLGYDLENDNVKKVLPTGTAFTLQPETGYSGRLEELSSSQTYQLNGDILLGASKKITQDLGIDAAVGGNLLKNGYEYQTLNGGPFIVDYLYVPKNVVTYDRDYKYWRKEAHSGYYTVDFNYKDFLTLSHTGRYDVFSTLAGPSIPKSQTRIFTPSVSGSFIFSELANLPVLNYGKLRASFAQTSGEPVDAYQTAVYYEVASSLNGIPTGRYSDALPSGLLKPYKVTEFEVGTELKFFDNRLGLDVAYFNRKTKNEVMQTNFSTATGYSKGYVPTGSTQNRGVEVLITGTPIAARDFSWNASFNFTYVKNKVLETDDKGLPILQGTNRFNHDVANTVFVKGESGPQIQVNDFMYDAKGNIVVDQDGLPVKGPLINAGSVLPTVYGGFNNEFNYKGISLAFLLDYNYGNKILSSTATESVYRGLNKSTLVGRDGGVAVGVHEDGTQNTTRVNAQAYYQHLAQNITKISVLDGDYIKLRQVTLGYTLPETVLTGLPLIRSVQVSLVGRNLWTLLKRSDNIDPEAGFATVIRYAGIEGTGVPSTRTYGVNVNIKFK
jgi:TonB-linked SusC/RagA family outer membrane protein